MGGEVGVGGVVEGGKEVKLIIIDVYLDVMMIFVMLGCFIYGGY